MLCTTLTTRAGQKAPLRSLGPRTSTLTKDTLERVLYNVRYGSVVVSWYMNMNDSLSVETVAQSVRSNAVTRGQDIRVLSQN